MDTTSIISLMFTYDSSSLRTLSVIFIYTSMCFSRWNIIIWEVFSICGNVGCSAALLLFILPYVIEVSQHREEGLCRVKRIYFYRHLVARTIRLLQSGATYLMSQCPGVLYLNDKPKTQKKSCLLSLKLCRPPPPAATTEVLTYILTNLLTYL